MSSRLLHKDTRFEQMPWRQTGGGGLVDQTNHEQSLNPQHWGGLPKEGVPGSNTPELTAHEQEVKELEGRILLLKKDLESERKKAHAQGYQEGVVIGVQQESAKWAEAQNRLAATLQEVSKAKSRFRSESEEDAVKLAIAIAKKVLHREVTVDPESLLGLVKAALTKFNQRELHRVRLHPADATVVEQLFSKHAGPIRIEVLGDPSLERGAALFETERGTLDASVNTQLCEIERGLTDMLSSPSNETKGR